MDYIRSIEIYSVVLSPFQLQGTHSVTHSIYILYCNWTINVTLRQKHSLAWPQRCHPKQHVIAVWNSFIILNIWICWCACMCVCACVCACMCVCVCACVCVRVCMHVCLGLLSLLCCLLALYFCWVLTVFKWDKGDMCSHSLLLWV